MTALRDIETPEDIRTLVDRFYEKVNEDGLLAPIFNDVALRIADTFARRMGVLKSAAFLSVSGIP